MNLQRIPEKAVAILENTRDGDDLDPRDLALVEIAINGQMSADGKAAFETLYQTVSEGRYQKPWLLGIEHMTADLDGHIYYKGHRVEHYDQPWNKAHTEQLKSLKDRCEHIERLGFTPNTGNVIWRWGWYRDCTPDTPYLGLLAQNWYHIHVHPAGAIRLTFLDSVGNQALVATCQNGQAIFESVEDYFAAAKEWTAKGWTDQIDLGQGHTREGRLQAITDAVPFKRLVALFTEYQVPKGLHEQIAQVRTLFTGN